MNTTHLGCALFSLAFFAYQATTTEPEARLLPPVQNAVAVQPAGKDQPKPPEKDKNVPEKKLTDPPQTDVFTEAPVMGNQFPTGFNPQMMGDWQAKYRLARAGVVGTTTTIATVQPFNLPSFTTTTTAPTAQTRTLLIPVPIQGAFKVAENASPMPVDRVYFTYNFYNDIRSLIGGQNVPVVTTQTTTTRVPQMTTTSRVTTVIPGAPTYVNMHRETLGFEKTFLDGNASIEVRLPFSQQPSNLDEFRSENVGDITVIGKYALYLDRSTGNVFSAGLAVTAPTGPGIETIDGTVRSTLLQPWFGYVWNFNRLYVHAFHSAVFPTDDRDVSLLFNDVGVGYWLYRAEPGRLLSFVVPTFEAHVTTPLSNRGANEPLVAPDLVVLTSGLHLGVGRNSILSLGAGLPVTGPRPYGFEGFVQFNRRF